MARDVADVTEDHSITAIAAEGDVIRHDVGLGAAPRGTRSRSGVELAANGAAVGSCWDESPACFHSDLSDPQGSGRGDERGMDVALGL